MRTLDLARNYDKRRFPWMVNETFKGYAFSQSAPVAGESPPPIVLLEFGINGVSWVDVLLRRLRARCPRAILVYVDLTSLYSWRKSTGRPQEFVWNEAWEAAPTCTTQMQGWLQSTGTEFWSMRSELRRRGVSYSECIPPAPNCPPRDAHIVQPKAGRALRANAKTGHGRSPTAQAKQPARITMETRST